MVTATNMCYPIFTRKSKVDILFRFTHPSSTSIFPASILNVVILKLPIFQKFYFQSISEEKMMYSNTPLSKPVRSPRRCCDLNLILIPMFLFIFPRNIYWATARTYNLLGHAEPPCNLHARLFQGTEVGIAWGIPYQIHNRSFSPRLFGNSRLVRWPKNEFLELWTYRYSRLFLGRRLFCVTQSRK